MRTVADLLTDWVEARHSLIWEFSGSIERDTRALVEEARSRAAALGVDLILPDEVQANLDRWDEERSY